MYSIERRIALIACLMSFAMANANSFGRYVDPKIGSEGLGRTFIGPSTPYGMVKPSPDGVSMPNSGWAPMPEAIKGFSQVHVSGTGGGQKYGNILIMPFVDRGDVTLSKTDTRADETIELGYYSTTLASGINVQVTTADKAAFYEIAYSKGEMPGLVIDAGAYLGMSSIPDGREAQQLVGSQIEIASDHEVKGYNRVRGGWNNGRAYTVYFYAVSDVPFATMQTWRGDSLTSALWQADVHQPTGAMLTFPASAETVKLKIGISFISELKARENLYADIPGWDFNEVKGNLLAAWEEILSRVEIAPSATEQQRRMFYTGLYHTMLMPTDRSGENPLWADDTPYYDDYYAIWDTYRTSSPLITLIDSKREIDIINSMLSIYRRDGYLPDARSGNANGRTQGGSNAEIVIADAYVKGLKGIDYDLALEAMLKDADVPPGGNEEAEGRGGLVEYNRLGYIPHGIPRAGNRTVEYSLCDFAIAEVAKGLGKKPISDRFMRQSGNWKNLWRDDYEHLGAKGFIMPRDQYGNWIDSLTQGTSEEHQPKYAYTPVTFEGPWYTPWWDMFMYEASSWEYSLSVPHDVPGLIEKCGGKEAFECRLDTFFDKNIYNVNNEPSFLTPYLYHWIGKPWRSSERIHGIVAENYNDTPMGLPGNDDSGAMSSWLVFNMAGVYPNAGQSYYLIGTPLIESTTFHLDNGKDFTIEAKNLNVKNRYIQKATLNGKDYPYSTLNHSDLMAGGKLALVMGSKPSEWGKAMAPIEEIPSYQRAVKEYPAPSVPTDIRVSDSLLFTFKPHGQTRRYAMTFAPQSDGSMVITWGIERNLKWQQGTFKVSANALKNGSMLDMRMPIDGENVELEDAASAYVLSQSQYDNLKSKGMMVCNKTIYQLQKATEGMIYAIGEDGSHMWIQDNASFPVVLSMAANPLNVNWTVSKIQ